LSLRALFLEFVSSVGARYKLRKGSALLTRSISGGSANRKQFGYFQIARHSGVIGMALAIVTISVFRL